MARFRLSRLAQADLARILATSAETWGMEGRHRYTKVLAAVMRKVAAEPESPTTRDRPELSRGVRCFYLRNAGVDDTEAKVRRPVHVLYYRVVQPGIEIVRILHERMDPSQHGL
jgi:toxin ParE1/3/4